MNAVDEPADLRRRTRMVRDQLADCPDARVVAAMAALPRHAFVPANLRVSAYDDSPLPIGCGQTISQPRLVARMLALLDVRPGMRVLDVGAGSGYAAALLHTLGGRVLAVERQEGLIAAARSALAPEVELVHGDAVALAATRGPFDRIHTACAAEHLPPSLVDALAPGGVLIAPVGGQDQRLVRIVRRDGGLHREELEPVWFVPLLRGV